MIRDRRKVFLALSAGFSLLWLSRVLAFGDSEVPAPSNRIVQIGMIDARTKCIAKLAIR
jgi:hypothetical protein